MIAALIVGFCGLALYGFSEPLGRKEIFDRFLNLGLSIKIRETAENEKYMVAAYKFCGIFLILVSAGLFIFSWFE